VGVNGSLKRLTFCRLRKDLHVNLGWVVQIYNTSEALPNLINPFWMLPLLGLLKVKARDLIGYGMLYFMVNLFWCSS